MQEVRLNLYQADREFQVEIGGGGFGYRLLGPKFDGSSRLIKSVILSDRDKEEIIGYVKPDAKAIEEERDRLKAELADEKEDHDICEAKIKREYEATLSERDAEVGRLREILVGILAEAGICNDLTCSIDELSDYSMKLRKRYNSYQELYDGHTEKAALAGEEKP